MVSCMECGVDHGYPLNICRSCNKVHFCEACFTLRTNDVKSVFQVRVKGKWNYDYLDMKDYFLRAHTLDYSRVPVREYSSMHICLLCSISKITDGEAKAMLGINKTNSGLRIDTNSCFTSLLDIWTERKESL